MHRGILIVLLATSLPLLAQLQPCPDNGESTSTRTITPTTGTALPLAKVPRTIRERAEGQWRMDFVSRGPDHPEPASGVHVKAARVFRFPHSTFYLVRVNDVWTVLSPQCPPPRCTSNWWDEPFTLLADKDRSPSGVPGDEFYVKYDKRYPGRAVLFEADPFEEHYDLAETCTVKLMENTK